MGFKQNTLEKRIERKCVRDARLDGWKSYKFVSPMHNGVPDRIFIKQGVVVFVEFKSPDGVQDPLQLKEEKELLAVGANIVVMKSSEGFLDVLNNYLPIPGVLYD